MLLLSSRAEAVFWRRAVAARVCSTSSAASDEQHAGEQGLTECVKYNNQTQLNAFLHPWCLTSCSLPLDCVRVGLAWSAAASRRSPVTATVLERLESM